jgi:hypothetical protein
MHSNRRGAIEAALQHHFGGLPGGVIESHAKT